MYGVRHFEGQLVGSHIVTYPDNHAELHAVSIYASLVHVVDLTEANESDTSELVYYVVSIQVVISVSITTRSHKSSGLFAYHIRV